ncbi:hypothetical protein HYV49_02670 [Candidatus Pacearchaeota archaeon]|nr:hypothetical protein [Candidatus Pacearchaeota archaeon]
MEEVIQQLIGKYKLPSNAFVYLDSIAYQELEAGISPDIIISDLEKIAHISSRYNDKVNALIILDRSMEEYLKKLESPNRRYCGSLKNLEYEELLSARENGLDPLSLRSLQQRISDHWFSSSRTRERIWGRCHRKNQDKEPYLLREVKEQLPDKEPKERPKATIEKHIPHAWAILFGESA